MTTIKAIQLYENKTFTHPFYEKTIVFTGALSTMTRSTAAKLATGCGARVHGVVTEQTDFVVLGDKRRGISSKQLKAERLIAAGADIQLLIEDDFLWVLSIEKGFA